jgi:hypothetical protein
MSNRTVIHALTSVFAVLIGALELRSRRRNWPHSSASSSKRPIWPSPAVRS